MITMFEALNYIGVVSFSASGSLKGARKGLDLLGCIVLGLITSYAGGIIAEVLLGVTPPLVLRSPEDLALSIAVSLITFVFWRRLESKPMNILLFVSDAVGLSDFAVFGAYLAVRANLNIISTSIIAMIVGSGGGVIRDVLVGEVPMVLRREIYASAAAAGGVVYYLASPLGSTLASAAGLTTVFALRVVSYVLGLELPKAGGHADSASSTGTPSTALAECTPVTTTLGM